MVSNVYDKELVNKIKEDFPNFDAEELLDFSKYVIPNIHLFFSKEMNDKLTRYCSEKFIKKVWENKNIYRISPDFDSVRVGYARLEEANFVDNELNAKVYTSVFFYDNVKNNTNVDLANNFDKYWNDIWTVSFKGFYRKDTLKNCPYCNTPMKYNVAKFMFTCENCKDSIYYAPINWKIVDIEVNKIKYM